MSEPKTVQLAKPVIGERERQEVLEVLDSGQLSLGPKLAEFEQVFADWLGVEHVSAVSSGTAGLDLALKTLGVGEGDEVVTSPFSFIASANSILFQGAKPVFVDIDPVTLNVTPEAVKVAVTDKTKAVLPVDIFGTPIDIDGFEELGLPIVEDACEALGARYADGSKVGAKGNLSVFGFYANKQLTTGEGGMVVCPDTESKEMIDSLRNQGRAPDMQWLDHTRLGYNYRLSDLHCALGVAQVARLDSMLAQRERIAALYTESLKDIDGLVLPCELDQQMQRGWFVYVVQLPSGTDRQSIIETLRAAGIASKPYLPAIHLFSFYREQFGYSEGDFPICEQVAERSLALPFFPEMGDAEVKKVCDCLQFVLN